MSAPEMAVPPEQQAELMQAIEQMQVRDSLRMYNDLVEKCFRDCIDSFRRKDLDSGEERCVMNCTAKFMKISARMGVRFAEMSQQAESQLQQIAQAQSQ